PTTRSTGIHNPHASWAPLHVVLDTGTHPGCQKCSNRALGMPIEQCNAMVYVALGSVSFQELIPFMRIGVLAVPLALTLTVAATATQAQEPGAEVRVPSETGGRPSAGALRIIAPDRHLAQAFRRAGSDLETRLVCGTGRTGGLVGDGERGTWASTEGAVAGALGLGVAGRLTPMRVVLADLAVRQ